MSETITKEVDFRVYCPKCKHYDDASDKEPCNSCLAQGWNYNSHKPINYKDNTK